MSIAMDPLERELVVDILAELKRARAKFPGPDATFAAMVEEAGEVATAMMEEPVENVRKEAIQLAVMAIRIVLDGDCTMNEWREKRGLDKLGTA